MLTTLFGVMTKKLCCISFQSSWSKRVWWYHWQCCWYHVMLMPAPMVSHNQKLCCTSPPLSWPKEWNGAIDNTIGIMWCHHWCQRCKQPKMSCGTSCRSLLTLNNAMVPLMTPWHHVMQTPMTWHDQKCHVASHFSCLNLRNEMVPLMMLWAAYDTDTSAYGIKLPKCHVAPHFNILDLRNAMMPLTILSVSHDAMSGAKGVTWPWHDLRKSMLPLMVMSTSHDTNTNAMQHMTAPPLPVASCNANVDVMWWHHMTKNSCWTSFHLS